MSGINLHGTMDADVWAKEFVKIRKEQADPINIELMRSWFANSIMCGHDHARWKMEKELNQKDKIIEILKEALDQIEILDYWGGDRKSNYVAKEALEKAKKMESEK